MMFTSKHADTPDRELHKAARRGDLQQVRKLLALGEHVDTIGQHGYTALEHAAVKGHVTIVEALLDRGAQVNHTSDLGLSVLHAAIAQHHVRVAEVLLIRGADVIADSWLGSALHRAAEFGPKEMVELLLMYGGDVHRTDSEGNTPLHRAAKIDYQSVALALWRAGADPLKRNKSGETPLSLLPTHSSVSVRMRDAPRPNGALSPSQVAELRHTFTALAAPSYSRKQTVTAQDAVPKLHQILKHHLRESGVRVAVREHDVEDAVMEQMDQSTCLLGMSALIKSFHKLQRKYKEPPDLRVRFKDATRSKSVLNTRLAKRLLRALFEESSDAAASTAPVSFTRSANEWNNSDVDTLLKRHKRNKNGIDEEAFVQVGMKVLFA